jgi:hypothetical protein
MLACSPVASHGRVLDRALCARNEAGYLFLCLSTDIVLPASSVSVDLTVGRQLSFYCKSLALHGFHGACRRGGRLARGEAMTDASAIEAATRRLAAALDALEAALAHQRSRRGCACRAGPCARQRSFQACIRPRCRDGALAQTGSDQPGDRAPPRCGDR